MRARRVHRSGQPWVRLPAQGEDHMTVLLIACLIIVAVMIAPIIIGAIIDRYNEIMFLEELEDWRDEE